MFVAHGEAMAVKTRATVLGMLMLVCVDSGFAQHPSTTPAESHKYRTLFSIGGGAGGFAIGLFAGLPAFDDATNSEAKVTTTAILAGVGGAVGGYFLGRSIDKSRKQTPKKTVTSLPYGSKGSWTRNNVYPTVVSLGIAHDPVPQVPQTYSATSLEPDSAVDADCKNLF